MVGYIYLITDTTNGMKYTGKHHYHIEGQLDPNYHGSGTIIKNIYKKRPKTLKEEYIKTCYSEEEMNSDEQHYIEVFDTLWPHGYNLTKGGDGSLMCEETRRKLSEALSGEKNPFYGRQHSEESKKKISESKKGLLSGEKNPMFRKHHSEESKKKMSDARKGKPAYNKGKPMSEETKRKLSESQKGEKNHMFGKHHSEETKQKISETQKGKHHSEETKQKISEAQKGKHPTEETRRKMSESRRGEKNYMFGKHHSEETKKKIGEKSKGRKSWNKGIPMSEEQKRKLSESLKGRPSGMLGKHHSEESKKKMSDARKGKTGPNKGKPMSEETKKKLSDARKGKKCPEITIKKLSKKVLQFTLDGEFVREWESTHECERNGFNRGAVYLCCNGKKPHYKGFKWCYK